MVAGDFAAATDAFRGREGHECARVSALGGIRKGCDVARAVERARGPGHAVNYLVL